MDKKLLIASQRHECKFKSLLREHSILLCINDNPNDIITNLTGETLTKEQESILRFGLKHNLATRPKDTEIIATVESNQQLNQHNLLPSHFIKQQKIKNSIRAFASNLLDFDNKQLKTDAKRTVSKYLKNYV